MPVELARAIAIETLCRRYPAYTPERAARAPIWIQRHIALLEAAGFGRAGAHG